MKAKAQEWFLVKKNWIGELEDLTDEQFGSLIRSLYSSQCPEGTQKIIYKTLIDEFDRVNEKREEGLRKRREASKRGNEVKAQSKPSGNPINARTHTHTRTNTHTQTVTPSKDKEELVKYSLPKGIKDIENTKLTQEEIIKKSNVIFK